VAELLQEQLKALGVQVKLQQEEEGIMTTEMVSGNYETAVFGDGWPNAGLLFVMYHSSMAGVLSTTQTRDPDLDKLLEAMGFNPDPVSSQEFANEAQKYIVEQAYIVPLYTPKNIAAVSNKVKGVIMTNVTSNPVPLLFDAYIETK
jgi:peptide/nickel transport system substrate-binding protein